MADFSEGWNSSAPVSRSFPILRIPNNEVPLEVTLHSRDFLCIGQHFFGRPYVCPGVGCPACDRGHGARVIVYFLVQVRREAKTADFLLELNRDVLGSFLGPERGCYTGWVLNLSRRRRRIVAQWAEGKAPSVSNLQGLRPLIDAVAILYKIRTAATLDSKLDEGQLLAQWRGAVVSSLQEMLRRALKD